VTFFLINVYKFHVYVTVRFLNFVFVEQKKLKTQAICVVS